MGLEGFYRHTGRPVTDTQIKFDVYQYYLRSYRTFIECHFTADQDIVLSALGLGLRRLPSLDINVIKKFLFIGWNTEFLCNLNNDREPEILKINNHWKPIQSYYAVYSIGEALAHCIDGHNPESHTGCIRKLNTFLVKQVKIEPWAFAFIGTQRRGYQPINFPLGVKLLNVLTRTAVRPVDMLASCLRAEHVNLIEDFTPRPLTKSEKAAGRKKRLKCDQDPGYTTILDFLHRLRIKSNYKDVEIFITQAPDDLIKGFSDNLSFMVNTTALLFESIIALRVGFENLNSMMNEYKRSVPSPTDLGKRLAIYESVFS